MPTRPVLTSLTAEAVTPALIEAVTALVGDLVVGGAALGWIAPPGVDEIGELLNEVAMASDGGNAECVIAYPNDAATSSVIGFGYWQRYRRGTHHPQADLPHLAVASAFQGEGIGGQILGHLITTARNAGIEQLTLDSRGDNQSAMALWRSRKFVEYGRLTDFVAVGERRYDKTFWVLNLANRPSP